MQTDRITRVLLAAILLCLVVLIAQNLRPDPPVPAPVTSAAAPEPEDSEETYRDYRGREVKQSDLVVLIQTVGNEALPMDMRVWAALQLQGVANEQASETLIAALDDENEELSTAALQALAGNRDPRVRQAALAGLEHDEEDVRVISRYVLESLGEKPAEGR